ncbi:caspase family protein [Sedimentitalea sp. HM32M-2]|uniref:caspase family protein n=1 Tax=Sedimentitalea sp. HM32M-2 TaxID=3351566 RepID=UPI00362EE0F9
MRLFLAVFFCLFCLPLTAAAEKRFGLVIGNDLYSDVPPLDKAGADAQAISAALTQQGFDIITVLNADRRQMNRTISSFTERLQPGDTAFVFFAGHGVEIDGENYLLPTDILAPASGERDFIKAESIALSALLDRVRATGARMTVAIVDACRNNPFQTSTGRSIGGTRGLGRITAPQGTFVIFSAGAGQLALDELTEDDPARNSVFTRALLPRLTQPGLELREMVAGLRLEVRDLARTVNHQQFPAYYDELLGEFYFARTAVAAPALSGPVSDPTISDAPARMVTSPMRADFELARSLGTAEALRAFLDSYSNRSDEFTYRMAVQMLRQKSPQPDPAPTGTPEATAATEPSARRDARAIIKATQSALNAAGCSAGPADGVIGQRTRRAFRAFINDTGSPLRPAELGTERALNAVQKRGSKRCEVTAAAPTKPDLPEGHNIAGNWQFRASCPLFIKTTGTARYTRTGPNTFKGVVNDSLGQRATTRVTLTGREMKFVLYWPSVTIYASGTLAADGNTYSNVASNGCTATAWRS